MRIRNLVLGAVAVGAAACSSPSKEAPQQRTPVRVQLATTGPALPAIITNGIVATKDEMRLSFKVGGIIKSISVEEGQSVRRGQHLAEIELAEINAQLDQAHALAAKAERDLDRGERLYADEVISLEQLQDLRTQASMQKAQLKGVEFNRGYSVITSPCDGVVLRKLVQERELIPAGQAVLIVGAHGRGYVVRAALSDRELVQLKLGDSAEIRMDAYPGRTIVGTLTEIANAAEDRSGLFPVEIRFATQPVALASGLVAKLRLYPAAAQTKVLTYVPVGAVVEGSGAHASVFIVNGDRVKRQDVHAAFIETGGVALSDGVEPGEHVVTDGALYLQDNDRIEVVQDATKVAGNVSVDAR
jgi:membrane fusion protein, multidrug efflux system